MSEVSISDFTELIREADRLFETVGGSTRHYVADCLLPLMEEKGMKLINTQAKEVGESEGSNEYYLRYAWDRTIQERDELKNTNKALLAIKAGLERSYKEATDKLKDYEALSKHNKDLIADLNAQRNQLRFKDEQVRDLKEKLVEAIRKTSLLEKQIEDLQDNIRRINNLEP